MDTKAFYKISYGLYIISSGDDKIKNGFVGNTVFQVTSEPKQIAVTCNKNNYTSELIEKNKKFSISILRQETKAETIRLFGYTSGKDVDKFADIDYKTSKNSTPIVIEDTISWFDCELVQSYDVGTHIIFIGKVIDSEILKNDEEPLTYAHYRDVKKGKAPKNSPTYQEEIPATTETGKLQQYECSVCGYIYKPENGDPKNNIEPGTSFDNLPENWVCPVCGAEKKHFRIK